MLSVKAPVTSLVLKLYSIFFAKKSVAISTMMRTPATSSPGGEAVPLGTMQPYHKATPGQLQTFELPQEVTVNEENSNIRKALIEAWRKDGILQIRMTLEQSDTLRQCFKTSKEFFSLPAEEKATYVDD